MYYKKLYGTYHLRSIQEVSPFTKLSSSSIRQKDSKSSTGSNYQPSLHLVYRRELTQEFPQTSKKAWPEEEITSLLTLLTYTFIISLAEEVNNGKR